MRRIGQIYVQYPRMMSTYAKYLTTVEHYGSEEDNMWDLAGVFYMPEMSTLMDDEVHKKLLYALKETVVYCVRGSGRSAARGLSYCYAVSFDTEELEVYARNCPMPHYLALLDAITPWTAPDWVYETAERLPELSKLDQYRVIVEKVRWHDDMPGLSFVGNYDAGVGMVRYRMFRKDEDTGDILLVGIMPTYYDATIGEKGVFQLRRNIDQFNAEIEAPVLYARELEKLRHHTGKTLRFLGNNIDAAQGISLHSRIISYGLAPAGNGRERGTEFVRNL